MHLVNEATQVNGHHYCRQCNNEVLRMQRASQDQLGGMVGTEYQLLFVQPNILFVVRKQHRASPTHVTPIADYYIINGHIYQVWAGFFRHLASNSRPILA